MKLYYTTNSPFARKVLIVAAEHRLGARIDLVVANPWLADSPVPSVNPAGKIPALVRDDGEVLYDSRVICEYLDAQGEGPRLFPAEGDRRWSALRRAALGDATAEAMVSRRLESRRPEGERSQAWLQRQRAVVERCVDRMESEADALAAGFTIAHVTWMCALAHLDFRFGDEPWRDRRPKLAAWFASFEQRESIRSTVPFD